MRRPLVPLLLALLVAPALLPPAAAGPVRNVPTLEGPEETLVVTSPFAPGTLFTGAVYATVAGVGVRHALADVRVYVDGVREARVPAMDAWGRFSFAIRFPTPGVHTVQVVADEGRDLEGWSAPLLIRAAVPPGAPTEVAVGRGAPWNMALVSWSPPVDDGHGRIAGYLVERSTAGGPFVAVGTTDGDARSLATPTQPHESYAFRVRARNIAGIGPLAEVAHVAPAPPPVDALTAAIREFRGPDGRIWPGQASSLGPSELWMSGVARTDGIPNGPGTLVGVRYQVHISDPCTGEGPALSCPTSGTTSWIDTTAVTWADGSYSATKGIPMPTPSGPESREVWKLTVTVSASSGTASASATAWYHLFVQTGGEPCPDCIGGSD